MSIRSRLATVEQARTRAALARHDVGDAAGALLAHGRAHPLATVGAAAGAGFVLGRLNLHPLRLPGLGSLLGGALAQVVTLGSRLIAELGTAGLGAAAEAAMDGFAERP